MSYWERKERRGRKLHRIVKVRNSHYNQRGIITVDVLRDEGQGQTLWCEGILRVYWWLEDSSHKSRAPRLLRAICNPAECMSAEFKERGMCFSQDGWRWKTLQPAWTAVWFYFSSRDSLRKRRKRKIHMKYQNYQTSSERHLKDTHSSSEHKKKMRHIMTRNVCDICCHVCKQ